MFLFGGGSKRQLQYAGTWYQSDPAALKGDIDSYIADAEASPAANLITDALAGNHLLCIVVPHAGYLYSGRTAAYSYLAAKMQGVKRVFLLGPSHYHGFSGAGLSTDKSFATVYGDLECDTAVAFNLKNNLMFANQTEAHKKEHSLELQLAFIKATLGDVKIVPVLIGKIDVAEQARFIAHALKSTLTDGDLIVVSSDFTHIGPRFGYQPFDGDWQSKLKIMDLEAASYLESCDLDGFFDFYKRTGDTICGVYAIATALALLPAECRGTLLDYRTSQSAQDDDNSVSYMSLIFAGKDNWSTSRQKDEALTPDQKQALIKLSRATLESFVRGKKDLPGLKTLSLEETNRLKQPSGAFVTLYKRESGVKVLRGCIGYIFAIKSLEQAVVENTISAASKDPRFVPVDASELAQIEIEISVLSVSQPVSDYKTIQIGTDGILLKSSGRQSVFLPQVATEFGWNLEETLKQLSLKAGLSSDGWRNASFEVFQSQSIEEIKGNRVND